MAKETESSKTETQKIAEGEPKKVTTVAIEEESKKLITTEREELKNATTVEGEKLKNATTAEGDEMKKVKLRTADDVTFEVELSIAKEMETVQSFIDASGATDSIVIPLPNVTSRYLSRIIEYCVEHCHVAGAGNLKELKKFDERFLEGLSTDELKELLLAANYLNVKNFFDFLTSSIANAIKNKSVEFVRNFFGITSDYTPEEEAEFRQVNAWAFQNIEED